MATENKGFSIKIPATASRPFKTAHGSLMGAFGIVGTVGATGAATLLQRYGSLEAALKAGRFPAMAENLRLYRSIATMDKGAAA